MDLGFQNKHLYADIDMYILFSVLKIMEHIFMIKLIYIL